MGYKPICHAIAIKWIPFKKYSFKFIFNYFQLHGDVYMNKKAVYKPLSPIFLILHKY